MEMNNTIMSLETSFSWWFSPFVIYIYMILGFFYLYSVYYYKNFVYNAFIIESRTLTQKLTVIIWNLFCSFGSAYMLYHSIGSLVGLVKQQGFMVHLCDCDTAFTYPLYGVFIYCVTKPLEYIDTFLLMWQNKNINFLHWYHHYITALLVLLIAINPVRHSTMGLWFGVINMAVHAIMYMYYAITAFKNPINGLIRKYSYLITIIQIIQMICGMILITLSLLCNNAINNMGEIVLYFGMYLSYFFLFFQILMKKIN